MKTAIAKALLQDALYQTLDNKVFRLLVILTGIPILLSFLVGFRPDEISFFFGFRTIEYSSFLQALGVPINDTSGIRIATIQLIQSLMIEGLSGSVGILFCIAATAFFVPRMLERGTADTLFSKPVSRLSLLLARYVSGVLFVFLLACVLVIGVHAGLTIVSGYSDPGFLWGILTLTYLFALVHSFSACVAVVTRSSTAAILCTIAFFWFTGCMHNIWMGKEHRQELNAIAEAPDGEETEDQLPPLAKVLYGFIDTAHYTLPKTSDADALTRMLRRSLEGEDREIEDATGGLVLERPPFFGEEFTLDRFEETSTPENFLHAWQVEDSANVAVARLQIQRLHERHETLADGSRGPELDRVLNARTHSRELPRKLEKEAGVEAVESVRTKVAQRSASFVRWQTPDETEFQQHEEILFGFKEHVYQITSDWKTSWMTEDQRGDFMLTFTSGMKFPEFEQVLTPDPSSWMEKQMSFTAPLRFNIFFSIGSSIAFAFMMLFIAWAVLRRIDF